MRHTLPALPYSVNALEPFLSAETLEFHHGKHQKGYVDKVNELCAGTSYENLTLLQLVKICTGQLYNQAAQAWNHEFFWKCLTPDPNKIGTTLSSFIKRDFGSVDSLLQDMVDKGNKHFGSGWLWLMESNGKLKIETSTNADNPICKGGRPLLTCDLWEHAYYIDYRNERPKYMEAFVEMINWEFVQSNLNIELMQKQAA